MQNFVLIGQTAADVWQFFVQNGGCPPPWICYVHVWTTHDKYLAVFITVQYLVGIAAGVATICKC